MADMVEKILNGLRHCMPCKEQDGILTCDTCPYYRCNESVTLSAELVEDIRKLLKEQQQKKGRWIDKDEGIARCSARCSCCEKVSSGFATDNGFSFDYSYHDYCPKCGAKMENPKEV